MLLAQTAVFCGSIVQLHHFLDSSPYIALVIVYDVLNCCRDYRRGDSVIPDTHRQCETIFIAIQTHQRPTPRVSLSTVLLRNKDLWSALDSKLYLCIL